MYDEDAAHTFWLDIERYKWGTDKKANQAFIKGMLDEISDLPSGTKLAIYSGYNSWSAIVGLDWDYPAQQGLNVWYAHYDGVKSYSDFKPFGGWTKPVMKQYLGNKKSCSAGIDYNYADRSFFYPIKTVSEEFL